ncbi:MAG: hypothetical protein JSS00_00805 [Proteobacteria bacterium]|nr:hypothetical protein [Pseudomonadota bacterium]
MTKSNSRRFVRAAWSLLFFQVIASAGAVAVTGWAAFHVQSLVTAQRSSGATPAPTEPIPAPATPAPAEGAPSPTPENTAPAPSNEPAPAPAPTATAIPTQPAIQNCERVQQFFRVPAQAEWCDTGVEVREGQTIYFRVGEGRWSNAPPPAPSYGPEGGPAIQGTWIESAPLGALIGRIGGAAFLIGSKSSVTSPASGHLLLAMNDVRGTYGDNRGQLDVFMAVR